MPLTPKGEVSYNVQVAVDGKHHLMVEQEVTNAVIDSSQLFFMAPRASGSPFPQNPDQTFFWETVTTHRNDQSCVQSALRINGFHTVCGLGRRFALLSLDVSPETELTE
jgi:hypothetical protein